MTTFLSASTCRDDASTAGQGESGATLSNRIGEEMG